MGLARFLEVDVFLGAESFRASRGGRGRTVDVDLGLGLDLPVAVLARVDGLCLW